MSVNKVVIVTGAGSGIGAATAKRFSRDGFTVVLNGRNRDKLETVAAELSGPNKMIVGDVSDPAATEQLVQETVQAFGGINVLVNNAGIARFADISEFSLEDWDQQMDINARGPFLMIKAALPHLQERQGNIVNVSSVSGIRGDWGGFGYDASKAAVNNLTRALALDFGSKGVRINAVAPSLTDTDMAGFVINNPDAMRAFKERIPMQRPAQPAEIADVIAFLASHDARFVNGAILPVDGGVSASNGQPNMG